MERRPNWLSMLSLGVVGSLAIAACTGATTPTTAPPAATTPPPAATTPPPAATTPPPVATTPPPVETSPPPVETSPPPVETTAPPEPTGTAYPAMLEQPGDPADIADVYPNYGGDVDCEGDLFNGLPYSGTVKSIEAPDANTVVFNLCAPDVAFLSKMAFSVFAINDSDYLIEHAAAGDLSADMNGTGPYELDEWRRGDSILYTSFADYWGEPAAVGQGVLRWSAESAARLQELQAGTIDGMTLVGPTDFETVRNDPTLELKEAAGLNTLYLGMNHDYELWGNDLVRQAIAVGVDRQRIVDTFLPSGSEVASHFTPCSLPFACEGDDWPDFDAQAARDLLTEAGYPNGFETTLSYRNVVRGYLPEPPVVAADLQAQLADIGITVTLDEQESGTYIANANGGLLEGLFLLGWGADYPDVTNFLDYHFGSGCTGAFGQCYSDIADALTTGASSTDEAVRVQAYTDANNAIMADVPMVPISHAGFANAYLADTGGSQVSPLSNELIFRMTPSAASGRTDQVIFMQNAEPIGLYCADETDGESLRACEQSMEGLYGFAQDGTAPEPLLAESCTANEDLSVYTCALRQGVTFHNGATFEAKDVLASFAAQWDAASPLHVGNTGNFEYWGGLWGGNLNPPAPCGIADQPACEEK